MNNKSTKTRTSLSSSSTTYQDSTTSTASTSTIKPDNKSDNNNNISTSYSPEIQQADKPKSKLSKFLSKFQSRAVASGNAFQTKDKEEEARTGVKKEGKGPNEYSSTLISDYPHVL